MWCLSLSSLAFSIYSTVPWLYGRPYDPLSSAILFPLNLVSWSLGTGTAVWLCVTGNGGFLGSLLSFSFYRPLSRTSYSVYLTHVWVVWVTAGARRTPFDLSLHAMILLFAAQVLVSFALGILFTVLFESPVIYALNYIKKLCSIRPVDAEKEDKGARLELVEKGKGGANEINGNQSSDN